jgi:hypothetical protein
VRRDDAGRRLRARLGDPSLDAGRGDLGVQGLDQVGQRQVEPFGDLERAGDLPRQPRRAALPHP